MKYVVQSERGRCSAFPYRFQEVGWNVFGQYRGLTFVQLFVYDSDVVIDQQGHQARQEFQDDVIILWL